MGLTIHYGISSRTKSPNRAKQLVEKMRQICMDLPFEEVDEVLFLEGEDCNYENPKYDCPKDETQEDIHDSLRWLLIQSQQSVYIPWTRLKSEHSTMGTSTRINPSCVIACSAWPGHGCEAMNFGLCRYPASIEVEYRPEDDARFQAKSDDCFGRGFSWRKWNRWNERNGRVVHHPSAAYENRQVKTGLGSKWFWSSFCKTQYASDPACGGIPNFLRCHMSAITALDRFAALAGVNVEISDEGHYGGTDGHYDVKALASEVGEWNTMIAGFTGALNDALATKGLKGEAPITQFSNFEYLEFKGQQNAEKLGPFLNDMKKLATEVAALESK